MSQTTGGRCGDAEREGEDGRKGVVSGDQGRSGRVGFGDSYGRLESVLMDFRSKNKWLKTTYYI